MRYGPDRGACRWRPAGSVLLAVIVAVSGSITAHAQQSRRPAAGVRDTAVFAGGCFWSMQKAFDHVPGVVSTLAGYAGGTAPHPTYEEVETGTTGHAESVQVVYDPAALSYDKLVNVYWHSIDPTDAGGVFCDRGPQYRPIIFVRDSAQRRIATISKAAIARHFTKPIAVQIVSATPFYPAEEYHQEFYKKNPDHYAAYREGCGRDRALLAVWGKEANR